MCCYWCKVFLIPGGANMPLPTGWDKDQCSLHILMLKLDAPQVMLAGSEAPNAPVGVWVFYLDPAQVHVGPSRLNLFPPILFVTILPGSIQFEPIQALSCLILLQLASWSRAKGLESCLSTNQWHFCTKSFLVPCYLRRFCRRSRENALWVYISRSMQQYICPLATS
jgi:hypothetical protein